MFRPLVDRPGTVSTCPECNHPFRSADSPRAPLILNCRHLCCEDCVRTALCTERSVTCKKCNTQSIPKSSLDAKKSNIRDSFPLSEKMVEEINKLTQMKPVDESCIAFKSSKRRSAEKSSPNTSLHEGACDECHAVLAVIKCKDCKGTLFCEFCFRAIHQYKVNQKHDYDAISSTPFDPMEKKPEYTKQLKENREKLLKKQEKIEHAIKLLNDQDLIKEAKSSVMDLQQVEEELKQFFIYCQNTIRCFENKVMEKFNSVAYSLDHSKTRCFKELDRCRVEIVEVIKQLYEVLGSEFYDSSLVEALLAKSRELLEKPDTILTVRPVCPSKKVEMPSKEWAHLLEAKLNFDFGRGGEFRLHKGALDTDEVDNQDCESMSTAAPLMSTSCCSDIGDSFERSSQLSLTLSERPAYQPNQRRHSKTNSVHLPLHPNAEFYSGDARRCGSTIGIETVHQNNRSIRSNATNPRQICGPSLSYCMISSQQSKNHLDAKTYAPRSSFKRQVRFSEGFRGSVVISCVSNPSYFYVQLECALPTLAKYRQFFANAHAVPPVDKDEIKTGNVYLAQCADGEWYRVRFSQIIPIEQSALVTQIDTGRTEMVQVSQLRRIDDVVRGFGMDPELAIQCSIYKCYPIGNAWSEEDSAIFSEALKDKHITMVVQNVQSNKLEVDLFMDYNGTSNSIREYMIGLGRACLSFRKDSQNIISTNDNVKYFKDTNFKPKEWVDVKATYMYGPDEIYVKRQDAISDSKFLEMNAQLDAFYKNSLNYKQNMTAATVGAPVAAQFTLDNTWYRAEILSYNHQSKKAEVRYVDFGNKEVLPMSKIRSLPKEFARFTVQTIKCSLAGIKPINGTKYKSQATNFLINNVDDGDGKKDIKLKMVVEEVKGDELRVILFRLDEDEDVCVNSLLVEEGYAKKVGDFLRTGSTYPKREGVQNLAPKSVVAVENPVEVNTSVMNASMEHTSIKIETRSNDAESNVDETESTSKISSVEEVSPEDASDNDRKTKSKYQVKIMKFVSPNRFYVMLVSFQDLIQQQTNDMTKFYRDEKDKEELRLETIEKDAKCVAYSENSKKWYRTKVLEVTESGHVLAYFIDYGIEETVRVENLRKLDTKFDKLCDGVVICHMADIEERAEWPAQLLKSLVSSFDGYNSIFITKQMKEEGKTTMPVIVWGKNVSCQGAFDPPTEEWMNVNELLAKAIQNDDLFELDSTSGKEKDLPGSLDAGIGTISSTETVTKWLQTNVMEAAEKGVEYSKIMSNGEIPPERLYTSPTKSISSVAKSIPKSTANQAPSIKEEKKIPVNVPTRDWKSAEPIVLEEMKVVPTYLDEDFNVYVQTLGKQKKVAEMIGNGLQNKFENTTPLPIDLHWYPGEICIACFFLDNKWYRGRVLKVKDDQAFVEYVDFGNTEWVKVDKLRKETTLEHYPIQCHKIPIRSDCVPISENGEWPTKTLDLVHKIFLERVCQLKVRKEKGEDFYRIEKLILEETDVDVFDYLCQLGYATYASEPSVKRKEKKKDASLNGAIVETMNVDDNIDQKSDSSSSIAIIDSVSNLDLSEFLEMPGVLNVINDPFSIPQNPQDDEVIVPYCDVPVAELNLVTVEVIEILQLDEIVVHIVDCDNDAMIQNRQLFVEMNEELQKKGAEQPLLESPSLGRMCCTKFDDNVWYRAKIINCGENDTVNILYVDYGNSSHVDPRTLHEMKRSWFDVPIQSIRCKLIDYATQIDLDEMLKLINKQFEAILETSEEPHYYRIKILCTD